MKKLFIAFLLSFILMGLEQCKKDPSLDSYLIEPADSLELSSNPTPYQFSVPPGFPTALNTPSDNPLTMEGVALGKKLFYDPILSGDNSMSCGSCHAQAFNFSDNNKQFSKGITGAIGNRNAQTIVNAIWSPSFFWDGRAKSLEEQALAPVPNPIEMHLSWVDAVSKINKNADYPRLFYKAFQTNIVTKELVAKAIAQFERSLISANSRFDRWRVSEDTLSLSEKRGYNIFYTERGDCFHCHTTQLFTDNSFHNNGLDAFPNDSGRAIVTKSANDVGKFKSPTLRNIELSAPYMHDGRFATLEQVVEFYSTGVKFSSTIDPLMKRVNSGGLQLNAQDKKDLVAFLKTLTDKEFINNPNYSSK